MNRQAIWIVALALVTLVVVTVTPAARAQRLADALIRIEINDTDGDAGIQMFVDGEGWRRLKVFDPDGSRRRVVRRYFSSSCSLS